MARGNGFRENPRKSLDRRRVKPGKAWFEHKHSEWSAENQRWVHTYWIYGPPHKQFLPSDQVIRGIITTLPDIERHDVKRCLTYDYIRVRTHDYNIFSKRASAAYRQILVSFLDRITTVALPLQLDPIVMEKCDMIFFDYGFKDMEWNGAHVEAHDVNGYLHTRRRDRSSWVTNASPYFRGICRLEDLCKQMQMPPFNYRAAPS